MVSGDHVLGAANGDEVKAAIENPGQGITQKKVEAVILQLLYIEKTRYPLPGKNWNNKDPAWFRPSAQFL